MTLKDLVEGAKAAAAITDNEEWKEARPAQVSVKEADLVAEVRKILARHTALRRQHRHGRRAAGTGTIVRSAFAPGAGGR